MSKRDCIVLGLRVSKGFELLLAEVAYNERSLVGTVETPIWKVASLATGDVKRSSDVVHSS